jgi:general secretion pathway protein J
MHKSHINKLRIHKLRMHKQGTVQGVAGFTLIELLVAISILAVVAVLGWRGLDSIVRARVALTDNLEQTRGMQLAFAQLQSDCAHIVSLDLMKERARLVVGQDKLTLIRTVFADNQPSRLQVVAYRIKDGQLLRRESDATRDFLALDAFWQAAQNETDATPAVVLQSGVVSMDMRLWMGKEPWLLSSAVAASGVAENATGLEVNLKLRGREVGMLKVFLLGAM